MQESEFLKSRGSVIQGQSQPILQPLSLSPSRVIKIMFNQVSKDNPFAVVENEDTPDNSHNISGFGSDDSLERGNFDAEPDLRNDVNRTMPAGQVRQNHEARPNNKLFSGVQRYSDSLEPYTQLKSQ